MYEIGDKVVPQTTARGIIEQIKVQGKEKVYVLGVLVGSMTVQIPRVPLKKSAFAR